MIETILLKKVSTYEEMLPQFKIIQGLTPGLTEDEYTNYLREMIPNNYFQVLALLDNKVIGLSGYWIATKIYCGRYLEIDNFIVAEECRNVGVGHLLVQWMENEATLEGCKVLMLDAYVENFKGHAFYYRHGFIARGFHYLKKV